MANIISHNPRIFYVKFAIVIAEEEKIHKKHKYWRLLLCIFAYLGYNTRMQRTQKVILYRSRMAECERRTLDGSAVPGQDRPHRGIRSRRCSRRSTIPTGWGWWWLRRWPVWRWPPQGFSHRCRCWPRGCFCWRAACCSWGGISPPSSGPESVIEARGGALPSSVCTFCAGHMELEEGGVKKKLRYEQLDRIVQDRQYLYLFFGPDSAVMVERAKIEPAPPSRSWTWSASAAANSGSPPSRC